MVPAEWLVCNFRALDVARTSYPITEMYSMGWTVQTVLLVEFFYSFFPSKIQTILLIFFVR